MHVVCYILPLVFGIMVAIPNYPAFVAPLYAVVCYPILFLGANKGQTTNDLFYTCNLPIRKRDVVKARLMTVSVPPLTECCSCDTYSKTEVGLPSA